MLNKWPLTLSYFCVDVKMWQGTNYCEPHLHLLQGGLLGGFPDHPSQCFLKGSWLRCQWQLGGKACEEEGAWRLPALLVGVEMVRGWAMPRSTYLFTVFGDSYAQRVLAAGLCSPHHSKNLPEGQSGQVHEQEDTHDFGDPVGNSASFVKHHSLYLPK